MSGNNISQIRRFNRLVTQRVGALQDSYLSRGRPLGEARLLFEIGEADGCDLAVLRQRLGLDSGYASRLLRSLESQGLVEVRKADGDGRARAVTLTEKGREEYAAYDALSDQLAATMLASLDDSRQARLVAAMGEVERLLRLSVIGIAVEPADSADARWCLGHYYAELESRFEGGFDPGPGGYDPSGSMLVARLDGAPVGCGVLRDLGGGVGEIKRLWVAPAARGLGLASLLMDRLEAMARDAKYRAIRLDTNRTLVEAQTMYARRGYAEIARYNDNPFAHRWYEKRL
jgi:DNA-binding MarR family transcriptional regulator